MAADILTLFRTARHIRIELRVRPSFQPLRGKNLALLMACPPGPESALLQAAAAQLGARVALVRYTHRADAQARDIETLASALGRMYDAIDCESLPAPVPQGISRCAGVPVTEALGSEHHRVCALADLMTLYEHSLPAQAPLSIRLLGDADTSRARVFLAAARDIGFDVLATDNGRAARNDATFVVDAMHTARWPLQARGAELDEARRADNHLRLIQAVLLDAMAGQRG
ncbi:MAG TPA: hypothetical protein VLJ19_19820 [Variovorax sp.]|nr:hypothetical protein [Variovorax sp.]